MNHLHFTDWITLSDRSVPGPRIGSRLRAIAGAGKPTNQPTNRPTDRPTDRVNERAGPKRARRAARQGPRPTRPPRTTKVDRRTVVRQLMLSGGLFARNPYPAVRRWKIK